MKHSEIYSRTRTALRCNRGKDLFDLSETLIRSEKFSENAVGYLVRGMAFELGDEGLDCDLERAAFNYRKATTLIPDTITFLHLARVLMKQGGDKHREALRYIGEAKSIRMEPEVDLAYAKYYEGGPDPDYPKARNCYMRAAFAGRFAGFFGYAAMSRKMGQRARALLVDCLRVVAGPILFLLLGERASKGL